MRVRGSCTLYQDVEINATDVIKELKKAYLSSLNIKSKSYLASDNMWCVDMECDHGSPIVECIRKATQEEINMLNCFNKLFDLALEK